MNPPQSESAIADYTRAIELNGDFAEAYKNRGDTYRQLSPPNYDAAIADFTEAAQIKPNFLEAQQNLAWAYHERGQLCAEQRIYDKAIADFTEVLRLSFGTAYLMSLSYLDRGRVYSFLHKYNEALSDFDEVIDLDGAVAIFWAYFHRGNIYHKQGRYKAALLEYNNAEKQGLKEPNLYRNRSATYAALDRQEEAEADRVRAQQEEVMIPFSLNPDED